MSKLSVVINTLNEAKTLSVAMRSVKELADEVVVVDMGSTDETVSIAKKLGAKVYVHTRLAYVEPARNFAIDKAENEWILVLDSDEEVSSTLAKKIKEVVEANIYDYVRIPRKNIIFGHFMQHTHFWPDYNVRLFRKGKVKWSNVIHTVPGVDGKGLDFEKREELALIHYHYTSVEQYVERMNRYTTVQAELKVKNGYKFTWRDMLVRPTNEFLSRYFGDEGYKDGVYGLALSLLQGFSELVFYLKIWQAEKFANIDLPLGEVVSEMRSRESDLHYWQGDSMFKEAGRLKDRVIRKLRI